MKRRSETSRVDRLRSQDGMEEKLAFCLCLIYLIILTKTVNFSSYLSLISESFLSSIEHAQKYVSYLSQCVQQLNHKTSKVRDAGDEIAKWFLDYTEKDLNTSRNSRSSTSSTNNNNEDDTTNNNINVEEMARRKSSSVNNNNNTSEENFSGLEFSRSLRHYATYLSLVEDHRDSMVCFRLSHFTYTHKTKFNF